MLLVIVSYLPLTLQSFD